MSSCMNGLLFFVFISYMGTQAVRQWGDCTIYTPDELLDPKVYPKPGYDENDCMMYPPTDRLCKWYKCPQLTCKKEDQVAPSGWRNNCHICIGTCYSAGKLHRVGTGFTASNNAAFCTCSGTGSATCNSAGANHVVFCNAKGPYPIEPTDPLNRRISTFLIHSNETLDV